MIAEALLGSSTEPSKLAARLGELLCGNSVAAYRVDGKVVALLDEGTCISLQVKGDRAWNFREGIVQNPAVRTQLAAGVWTFPLPSTGAPTADPYYLLNRMNEKVRIDDVRDMQTLAPYFAQ